MDEQFKFSTEGSGYEQIVSDYTHLDVHTLTDMPINKNGYLYIYTSNSSDKNVYFDNLQVTHIRGPANGHQVENLM